ncbi:hypothetical protein [Spirosoma sordidisoli]|nr:hypothetical protein [Spirosoma sordidisoli]
MKNSLGILVVIAALSACSRPVAYFQRAPVNLLTTRNTHIVSLPPLTQAIISSIRPVIKADTSTSELEFVARNNNKLIPNKPFSKHMARVKTWMTSTQATATLSGNYTADRLNTVEKVMVKKTGEKKSGQLAPSGTTKARANWIKLIGGAILLVAGVVIMLTAPGSIFFLGLVVALFGFVGVILGLFAE